MYGVYSQTKPPAVAASRAVLPAPVAVYGHIFARVANPDAPGGSANVFLPNVTVQLRGTGRQTSAPAPKSITNARGVFTSAPVAPGAYDVCWEAEGYEPGCTVRERRIVVGKTTTLAPPIEIRPRGNVVSGKVAPCFLQDPIFGIDARTEVTLVDAAGKALTKPVLANHAGEFLIPAAPRGDPRVRAECDGVRTEASLARVKEPMARLTFPDSRLRITSVVAADGDRLLRKAKPGQTVRVAVDVSGAEKDRLHYRWFTANSEKPFASVDAPSIDWTLPATAGENTMQVMVTDAAGTRRVGRVTVTTGGPEAIFSATVTDSDGKPLKGAEVSVNGARTVTNEVGYFFIRLPEESSRYLLNVHSQGYALWSRPIYRELVGSKLSLVRSESSTVEPRRPIVLGEGRDGKKPQLLIDADALVNADGKPPQGQLVASLATIDLRDPAGRLPGNFAAVDAGNQPARQKSVYGAVDIQFRDGSGQPYNLAPGKTATLRIPVAPATPLSAPAPGSVPLSTYDEQAGVWRQVGTATLAGNFYEATVSHFSAFSVGLLANDAACMRLHVDPGTVNLPVVLSVLIPANDAVGANLPPFTATLTAGGIDLISELPPNEPITLQLGSAELSKQVVSTGAATAGPANPNPSPASCGSDAYLTIAPNDAQGFDPANPQFSGGGFLNYYGLDDEHSADAYYAAIDPTAVAGAGTVSTSGTAVTGTGTSFQTFFVPGDIIRFAGSDVRTIQAVADNTHLTTFSVNPAALPNLSGVTYERVGIKTTLDRFKTENEFGTDDAQATYFNAGDLGFGRGMHMKISSTGTIAYYVSNYPNVEQARLQTGLIASVAMEFSPHPSGGASYTKFYVYNAAGARINNADLDNRGGKFVPRLCVICHAGTYVAPTLANKGNLGSRFIAFDLESYEYSGFDPAFSRNNQEENFRKLNLGIVQHTNPSAAATDLINGWYNHGGGTITTSGQTVDDTFTPSLWTVAAPAGATTTPGTLYADVLRASCRTCHVNRDAPLDWAKYTGSSLFLNPAGSGFKQNGVTVLPAVCGVRSMPHAKVTYINFWAHSTAASAPNRVDELRTAKLDSFLPGQPCPTP